MFKHAMKGTIIGGAVGMAGGVVYGASVNFLHGTPNDDSDYPFLEGDGEVNYLVNEVIALVKQTPGSIRKSHFDESSITILKTSLNRLIALGGLIETETTVQTSWGVLAQHHAEDAVDALRVVRHYLRGLNQPSSVVQFDQHASEIQEYINNFIHNLNLNIADKMGVQTK